MEKMNKVMIPNGGEAVMAEYREQEVMEYRKIRLLKLFLLFFPKRKWLIN